MKYIIIVLIFFVVNAFSQRVLKLASSPMKLVVDSQDNVIVLVYPGRVVKISPEGNMSYISEDIRKGITSNPLPTCKSMTIDTDDNIYMADLDLIWKLTPDGRVTLFAGLPYKSNAIDGPVKKAQFRAIEFIDADKSGNLYVAERDNTNKDNLGDFFLIRKISNDGQVTTLLNTRDNSEFKSKWISGMGVDGDGNIFVSDGEGRCIKKLHKDGTISLVAGMCGKRQFHPVYVQGDISKAELMAPQDILIDKQGNVIFSDGRLHRIIKVADHKVATIAGSGIIQPNNVNMGGRAMEGYKDGPALSALFNFPLGCDIAIDSKQNIFIIDGGNSSLRKLSSQGVVSTIAKQ